MNTSLILLASLSCFLALASGEPPVSTYYQHQKKLSTIQKPYTSSEPVDSPTNFGFVPVKTSDNYVQKEPVGRYIYPDLLSQTQTSFGKYPRTQAIFNKQAVQYSQQLSSGFSKPKTHQLTQHYYQPQQYIQHQQYAQTQQYAQPQQYAQTQQYTQPQQYVQTQQYVQPQQYVQTQQFSKHYSQPEQYTQQYIQPTQDYAQKYVYLTQQNQQPQYYYQPSTATKNVNYITDNNVPQYVYLHQTSDSSNAIENVVDSKGEGVKYIMFIPTYVPQQQEEGQNYQNYYATQDSTSHKTSAETVQVQPEQKVRYVYNTEPTPVQHSKEAAYSRAPTSLLDSYVPSALQVQYYKRLAALSQSNQVTDSEKAVTQSLKKKHESHER